MRFKTIDSDLSVCLLISSVEGSLTIEAETGEAFEIDVEARLDGCIVDEMISLRARALNEDGREIEGPLSKYLSEEVKDATENQIGYAFEDFLLS